MNQYKRIIFLPVLITLFFLFCLSTPLWAQPSRNGSINDYLNYYSQRQKLEETHWDWHSERQQEMHQEAIEAARYDHQRARQQIDEKTPRTQQRRSEIVTKTLDETIFKINTGYMFVRGQQTFRIPHPQGGNLSKLTYPIKGGMGTVNAEVKITPEIFLGGRYAHSNFRNTTSIDADWIDEEWEGIWNDEFEEKEIDEQVTEQNTKNQAYLWDANLYYRAFRFDEEDMGKEFSDLFQLNNLYIDFFAGYQYYKGKHTMIDPITTVRAREGNKWWYLIDPSPPFYVGLNSPYEVTYKGPRAGIRISGLMNEKFSSSLSLSYAWIKSNADAYWNLRDFSWRHRSKGYGSAFNLDFESEYHFASNWFIGGNFFYTWQNQPKSRYFGNYGPEGDPVQNYSFEYEARNTRLRLFGVTLKTGYRW